MSTIFFLLLLPFSALAALDAEFDSIKNTGKNFEVSGTVCEEIARVQVAKEFPAPSFAVVTGIAYGTEDVGVVGELDVIVFDKRRSEVIRITEVKCWQSFPAALKKASEQRGRFLKTLRSGQKLFFKSTSGKQTFEPASFKHVTDFTSIGQKGSRAAGFTDEIPYTLEEMMDLRARMMQCQARGRCPKD